MPGANAYGYYDGDAASSSLYGSSSQYGRTYLPYLPKRMKNKTLDHHRQALATSNDAYGEFWTSPRAQRQAGFATAGLPSNHDVLDRNRLEGGSTFLTSGFSPRQELKLPRVNIGPPHSPRPSHHSPRPASPPHRSQRLLTPPHHSPRPPTPPYNTNSPRIDLSQRIDFTPRKLQDTSVVLGRDGDDHLVAHFDPRTDLHMPDIKAIDITLHLNDDSSVVLKSMPFSCWDKLR
ncbi:hypothetical protein CAPTEDRAFT_190886 [Capitella teleta]|uniref:Uncharacterized protein n=1 Tax=Capitella teleta TaxID=283909 RepID=R7UAZ2_CAPTE|nr:hypothetical protein CAPTEDRAFT_190886 [Capitella teleta]|eukprot:ELU00417.1 hypothetical protein CAPTEDRAFT_190886 [Capitella teleta]